MKRHNTRTGREAKRRRRRHERRMETWFMRAGRTTNAALVDWPPLTMDGLQEAIDHVERLMSEHHENVFRVYGLNYIPPAAKIKIEI